MLAALLPLAQQVPDMEGTYWLLLTSRVLHILGAMILVGGLFYLRAVVTPSVAAGPGASSDAMFGGRRAKWAMLVGIATAFLLISGLYNYWQIITLHQKMPGSYHMLMGIKILLGFALFALAAFIPGRTPLADRLRENIRFWLNVCLSLILAILILASILRTYPRTLKSTLPPLPPPAAPQLQP